MRSNKGITLIALVITIIVLIILAGVAINLTLGENGILKKAEEAREKQSEQDAKEKLELVLVNARIEKETNTSYNDDYLDNMLEAKGITVNNNAVIVDNYNFLIDREQLIIVDSLGETTIRVTAEVQEYLGKNENGKYEVSLLLVVESNAGLKSVGIQNPDGTTFEMETERVKLGKDMTVELDSEYIVTVTTQDGNTEKRKIVEKSKETISSVQELVQFREKVNSGLTYEGKTVTLVADNIDLSSVCGANVNGQEVSWEPIGNTKTPFKGNLQGNDTTISNIYINTSNTYQGLFGYIENGSVKNLTINGEVKNSNQYIAGIAGYINKTTIENCANFVDMYADKNTRACMGGIVGTAVGSTIKQCKNEGKAISGYAYVGGIAGTISDCTIENCINLEIVNGKTQYAYSIGGITGNAGASTIKKCINKADVTGNGTSTGGITGSAFTNNTTTYLYDCYNTGIIYGRQYPGGISGYSSATLILENCYNIGTVTGSYKDAMVSKYSGTVTSANCYYLSTCGSSSYGTSKTDTQLQGLASTLGNAFTNDVKIKVINEETGLEEEVWSNGGYPILKWQIGE